MSLQESAHISCISCNWHCSSLPLQQKKKDDEEFKITQRFIERVDSLSSMVKEVSTWLGGFSVFGFLSGALPDPTPSSSDHFIVSLLFGAFGCFSIGIAFAFAGKACALIWSVKTKEKRKSCTCCPTEPLEEWEEMCSLTRREKHAIWVLVFFAAVSCFAGLLLIFLAFYSFLTRPVKEIYKCLNVTTNVTCDDLSSWPKSNYTPEAVSLLVIFSVLVGATVPVVCGIGLGSS